MSSNVGGTQADRRVGRAIERLRLERGFALAEAADRLGWSREDMAAIEEGELRPSFVELVAIAQLLECEISAFFL